jgi:glyoxylase-like metal-dependent hydrolase (beta-lactamase superfamily II)
MDRIPLEDNVEDIVGKVLRGRKLDPAEVARQAGVELPKLKALLAGEFDEATARAVAPVLGLGADALVALGQRTWYPQDPGEIDGLACFNTPYGDMFVNAFLVWDPATKVAAAFDTGSDCAPALAVAREKGLEVQHVFLTHTHPDHIADLARLTAETAAPAYVSHLEPTGNARAVREGDVWRLGSLTVRALATSGHTKGGTTYFVTGLARPVAAVGDAMFAGSMGGGNVSYEDALRNNVEKILALPDETLILPGHGPVATVGEQKQHNPFFTAVLAK